ncbi:hypothetical protein ACLB2K_012281 [Fragaria x ananassa]
MSYNRNYCDRSLLSFFLYANATNNWPALTFSLVSLHLTPHGGADSLSAHSLPRSAQPPSKTTLAADCDPHLRFITEALGCQPEVVNMWIGDKRSTTSFHKGHKHFFLLPAPSHRCATRSQYPYSPVTGEYELEIESSAIL